MKKENYNIKIGNKILDLYSKKIYTVYKITGLTRGFLIYHCSNNLILQHEINGLDKKTGFFTKNLK